MSIIVWVSETRTRGSRIMLGAVTPWSTMPVYIQGCPTPVGDLYLGDQPSDAELCNFEPMYEGQQEDLETAIKEWADGGGLTPQSAGWKAALGVA